MASTRYKLYQSENEEKLATVAIEAKKAQVGALENILMFTRSLRDLQIKEAFASAFKSIASEIGKFQVTAQAAIDANSVEGMRLESRRFINNFQLPKNEELAHVKTIDSNVKQVVANLNILNSSITGMVRNTQSLRLLTGTITYA